jgi:hypothetical protein
MALRFPQASIRSSILSVAPGAPGHSRRAAHQVRLRHEKRGDGGYTLAISGGALLDPTPQQVRFARQLTPMFLPPLAQSATGLGAGLARRPRDAVGAGRLTRPTPMEAMRVLDPRPDIAQVRETHARS